VQVGGQVERLAKQTGLNQTAVVERAVDQMLMATEPAARKGAVIDEAQHAPELFAEMQGVLDAAGRIGASTPPSVGILTPSIRRWCTVATRASRAMVWA